MCGIFGFIDYNKKFSKEQLSKSTDSMILRGPDAGAVDFFENETLVSIDPFSSFAYGGIKLKIHFNDFEKVQQLLDNLNNNLKIV